MQVPTLTEADHTWLIQYYRASGLGGTANIADMIITALELPAPPALNMKGGNYKGGNYF
jgi:hypothetical protein